jgi:L-threonylcarbamoyladenylate synthase
VTDGPVLEAAAAARAGSLVVFPTDTVYGIAARPDDAAATDRLFAAKGRPRELALPVLASSVEELVGIAFFDERGERLAAEMWPGALTMVLPRTEISSGWNLGGDGATVGVRIPRHPLAQAILAASGPLAATSANKSGDPPARTCEELQRAFGELVEFYICQEQPLEGLASTVIDLAHGPAAIVRTGSVGADALAALLPGEGSLLDSPPSPT